MKAKLSSLLFVPLFLALTPASSKTAAQKLEEMAKISAAPVVRVVYLIPSDRSYRREYAEALEQAIENVRTWHQLEMGGKTFALPKAVVEVVNSGHPAEWYSTSAAGSDASLWFWYNATADGFALTGGRWDDPSARWLYYIDADQACGQLTGAAAGVALFPANDLRGLVGETNMPPCSIDPPDSRGYCRWVGGLGHELGHTFGLPHPIPCPGGSSDDALMCLGYGIYPDTYLLPQDKTTLDASPFFLPFKLNPAEVRKFDCVQR